MASGRLVCVLRGERDELNLGALNCNDQSHDHVTRAEAILAEKNKEIEWVKKPASRKVRAVARVLKTERSYARDVRMRGMSAKYGATLASALTKRKEIWPHVMLADIRHRPLAPTPDQI